jgi:hypothetical protein
MKFILKTSIVLVYFALCKLSHSYVGNKNVIKSHDFSRHATGKLKLYKRIYACMDIPHPCGSACISYEFLLVNYFDLLDIFTSKHINSINVFVIRQESRDFLCQVNHMMHATRAKSKSIWIVTP